MDAAKKLVDETIKSKPVAIFSKSYCPYCVKAKNLILDELKVPADKVAIIELDQRSDTADVQTYLGQLTGKTSVPRVFIKGDSIGGCDDTFALHKTGQLKARIDSAIA